MAVNIFQCNTTYGNRTSTNTTYNNDEFRIVMVGKTGVGKSATGNTILGKQVFKSELSPNSLTDICKKAFGEVNGQNVSVIDTPGLCDTRVNKKKTCKDLAFSINYASPGPHVFLVLVPLGRYTEEEKNTVLELQKVFGEGADRYSMVLFTHGDKLKGKPIDEFIQESEELKELVAKYNGHYHVFNNEAKDQSQVTELLDKIRKMMEENGGNHYTTEMFQKAEEAIEEEKQRILNEKEEQMLQERERLEKKIMETKKAQKDPAETLPVSLLGCPHLEISLCGCLAPKISLLGAFPFRNLLYNRPLMVGGCIVFPFRRQNRQMRRSKFMKYHIIANVINYVEIMKTQQYI